MGIFYNERLGNHKLEEARAAGDWERWRALLDELSLPNGQLDLRRFDSFNRVLAPNLTPIEGDKYRLDLTTGVVSNTGLAWYFAEFSSNSTPTTAWDGDFGAASGGDCTEFTGYTSATRVAATFAAADGTTLVTAAASNQITISPATTATVYGICLTSNSTKQYSSGAAKLLAAARYSSAVAYAAGEVHTIGYTLTAP